MPDVERKEEISEIWVTENGIRHRVYRGTDERQIAWKLEHHKKSKPEVHLVPRK